MKLSELIEILMGAESQYGDVTVQIVASIPDDARENSTEIEGVTIRVDPSGNPDRALICDAAALLEFEHKDEGFH